jgi:streptogramin lyase
MQGGTFGAAVDANDDAWLSSYGGKSIAVFDKSGEPLTPPNGINFNGRLGLMQGIIVAPNGDVWAVGISKNQLLHFSQVRSDQGRDHLRRQDCGTVQVIRWAFPPRNRSTGPYLGHQ